MHTIFKTILSLGTICSGHKILKTYLFRAIFTTPPSNKIRTFFMYCVQVAVVTQFVLSFVRFYDIHIFVFTPTLTVTVYADTITIDARKKMNS